MGREAPHFVDEAVLLHFALFWGNSWKVTLSIQNSIRFAKILAKLRHARAAALQRDALHGGHLPGARGGEKKIAHIH